MGQAHRPENAIPVFSIALVSATALAFEILLMRLFSIIQWHHFAYMIISLALLGYGVSGTFLTLFSKTVTGRFKVFYAGNILLFGLSVLLCFWLAQQLPFNPEEILWDTVQPLYLAAIYLLLALPFFFVANAIGSVFMVFTEAISRVYAADLFGAGLGALAIIGILFVAMPEQALLWLMLFGISTSIVALIEVKQRFNIITLIALSAALLVVILPADRFRLNISQYKSLPQTLGIPGTRVVDTLSSPLGLITVVESPVIPLRHAPGLSLDANTELPEQIGVFTDADAMTVINRVDKDPNGLGKPDYLTQLTSSAPYHLIHATSTLVPGAGGGSDVLQAKQYHVKNIDVVELNPQIVNLVQQDYSEFAGNLFGGEGVNVHVGDARGYVASTDKRYDVIQLTLLDSFGASSAGLYALSENYLYTVEAMQAYLQRLTGNGMLAITRWVKLPPKDTLKLLATAVESLRQSGVKDPARRLLLIRGWQTSTLLIKNSDVTEEEIARLKIFCEARSFDTAWYPGMQQKNANQYNLLQEPLFYNAAVALLGDNPRGFIDQYKFNISPATDDRPYFSNFFKWGLLPEIYGLLGKGGMTLVEWGYVVLIATLLQAIILSAVLVLFPLFIGKQHPLFVADSKKTILYFAYFFALGLAFLFIEIAFIQKFVLFLHHPLYSVASILTAFLLFAGLGSAWSGRFNQGKDISRAVVRSVIAIVIIGVVYLVALNGLFSLMLELPMPVKFIVSILIIAPLAFFMGMPFPLGLRKVSAQSRHLIPWVWGVNGCASVISAVLAVLIAIHVGFIAVVICALCLYAFAGLLVQHVDKAAR